MTEGLDPDNIGSVLTDRTVIYVRLGCGAYGGHQINALVEWEEMQHWHSRPAIWVEEIADPNDPSDAPGLDRVSRLIYRGRVSTLVVWRIDRLAKTAKQAAGFIIRLVDKYKCRFVSVDDMIDTNIPSGKLFVKQLESLLRHTQESKKLRSSLSTGYKGIKPRGPNSKTVRLAPKVQQLLDSGHSKHETSKRLGISRGLIDNMISMHGLVTYKGRGN